MNAAKVSGMGYIIHPVLKYASTLVPKYIRLYFQLHMAPMAAVGWGGGFLVWGVGVIFVGIVHV